MARNDEEVRIIIRGEDEASKPIAGVSKALGKLDKAASKGLKPLTAAIQGVGLAAGAAAAGGIAALGVGLVGFAAAGLKTNNTFEQIEARLNAFNKDAKVTAKQIELIRKEAAKTPFAVDEMASAFAALQGSAKAGGVAIMDLIQTAEILAASKPLEGLEGASFALKEAITGDFTSIIERFNLSRASINQWKLEGVSNIEIVRRAMAEMGLDMDLVSAQANTLDGRMSTLIDSFNTFAAAATKPIFDEISTGLGAFGDELTNAQPLIDSFAALISRDLQNAITWLTGSTGLPSVSTVLATLEGAWGTARDAVVTFAQALGGTWVDAGEDKIDPLDRVMGNLAGVIRDVVLAFGEVWTAINDGKTPTDNADTALTSLADVLREVNERTRTLAKTLREFNEIGQPVADLLTTIEQAFNDAGAAVKVLIDPIAASFGTLDRMIQTLKDLVYWFARWKSGGGTFGPIAPLSPGSMAAVSVGPAPAAVAAAPMMVSGITVPSARAFAPIGVAPRGGGAATIVTTISVDARGARDPVEVERAGYRGARRALEEASRERVGRRSVQRLRTALDRRARIR